MKTAFVSGASRGIGRSVAMSLAGAGYDLAICCEKNLPLLAELAVEIQQDFGRKVLCFAGDLSEPKTAGRIGEQALLEFGRIDVVINNAGISWHGLLADMTAEEWQRVLSVNLSSVFYVTKAFIPQMVHQKSGHIVNISSIWGREGASCEVAYSAAKGGVDAFTKALAKELAPSGICVNAVSCGVIDTDMNRFLDEEEKKTLAEAIPAGHFGRPSDVGKAVLALLSTNYVTGQILGVDGGF